MPDFHSGDESSILSTRTMTYYNKRLLRYLERCHMLYIPKSVCLECKKVTKKHECCGKYTYTLGRVLRVPKIRASKKQWEKFEKLLFDLPYNKSQLLKNFDKQI